MVTTMRRSDASNSDNISGCPCSRPGGVSVCGLSLPATELAMAPAAPGSLGVVAVADSDLDAALSEGACANPIRLAECSANSWSERTRTDGQI